MLYQQPERLRFSKLGASPQDYVITSQLNHINFKFIKKAAQKLNGFPYMLLLKNA
jgi:hypothetical protein